MNYCRYTSDDFRSDVYVYAADDGWTIHVAVNRLVFAEPLPEPVDLPHPFTDDEFTAWWNRQRVVSTIVERSVREPIGLPYDGAMFVYPTPAGAATRLVALARLGYRVPVGVVETLHAEHADTAKDTA